MSISLRRRFAVLERDGFQCVYCGAASTEARLEIDHVHPRSRGGGNSLDNLVTACAECNRGKRDTPILRAPREMLDRFLAYELARRFFEPRSLDEQARWLGMYWYDSVVYPGSGISVHPCWSAVDEGTSIEELEQKYGNAWQDIPQYVGPYAEPSYEACLEWIVRFGARDMLQLMTIALQPLRSLPEAFEYVNNRVADWMQKGRVDY